MLHLSLRVLNRSVYNAGQDNFQSVLDFRMRLCFSSRAVYHYVHQKSIFDSFAFQRLYLQFALSI